MFNIGTINVMQGYLFIIQLENGEYFQGYQLGGEVNDLVGLVVRKVSKIVYRTLRGVRGRVSMKTCCQIPNLAATQI